MNQRQSDFFFSKLKFQISETVSSPEEGNNNNSEILLTLTPRKDDSDPELVSELEKRFALDTAALLGGNEYLVSQIYEDRCLQPAFTEKERLTLEWALNRLWRGHESVERARRDFLNLESLNQAEFHKLFSQYARHNIRRIVSNCLLYCGRYEDTQVLQNPTDPNKRCFLINLEHFPFIELPIGSVLDYPCNRFAIIYYKRSDGPNLDPNPSERIIKLSAHLALERQMLRAIHFVAAVPVP